MVAATILVVGFIGMIEAVTIGSGMMDHARRQTLANQIINHEIEQLRLQTWTAISLMPTSSTALGASYSASTAYVVGDTVTYNGAWYRNIQAGTGQIPSSSSSYWTVDTPPYANVVDSSGAALGATYTLTRSLTNIASDSTGTVIQREVTLTLTWVVHTSRRDSLTSSGNRLDFTFTRVGVAYFGKYGLNAGYQRS